MVDTRNYELELEGSSELGGQTVTTNRVIGIWDHRCNKLGHIVAPLYLVSDTYDSAAGGLPEDISQDCR